MARLVRFDYAKTTFERGIKRGPQMVAVMKDRAEDVEREAKQIARSEAYDDGDYHDGLEATAGVDALGAVGRLNAKDFKSHWIEFGPLGKRSGGAHVLFRALQKVLPKSLRQKKRG